MTTENIDRGSEAATVANLANLADQNVPAIYVAEVMDDQRDILITRKDFELRDITPPNKAKVYPPQFVQGTIKVQTVESLVAYVNRFKNADTLMFANIDQNTITGVIDYHKAPMVNVSPDAQVGDKLSDQPDPQRASHRVTMAIPFSEEWGIWNGRDDELMTHKEFASFLEEHADDIISPPGADLLELCKDLQMVNNMHFTSSIRHGNYNKVSFQKENDATAKGELTLPTEFIISIPVYFGEAAVTMKAFLRKKVDDDGLHLGYALAKVEQTRQNEFRRIVETVQQHVDLVTLYGQPG